MWYSNLSVFVLQNSHFIMFLLALDGCGFGVVLYARGEKKKKKKSKTKAKWECETLAEKRIFVLLTYTRVCFTQQCFCLWIKKGGMQEENQHARANQWVPRSLHLAVWIASARFERSKVDALSQNPALLLPWLAWKRTVAEFVLRNK